MDASFPHESVPGNITTTFFKCTRWLVEETGDLSSCPYHYLCDYTYPGSYPPVVDFLVLLFAIASYVSATVFTLVRLARSRANVANSNRRYLLPSGPVALPVILFVLANGSRIDTIFPLSVMGPSLLHLLHVSALAFEYHLADRSLKYALLEASAVSGILHSSLYLDSVIMPYYTGLDALTKSTFSGECISCVCRNEALAVGGGIVSYKGWSKTMAAVVATLCLRMLRRVLLVGEGKSTFLIKIEMLVEGSSWILIARDVLYLMITVPQENNVLNVVAYGGLLILIFLNVFRKLWGGSALRIVTTHQYSKKIYLCQATLQIP